MRPETINGPGATAIAPAPAETAPGGSDLTEAIDRFRVKHETADNGCWIWTAAKNKDGYGSFWSGEYRNQIPGKPIMVLAHRWAYEHYVGEIPEGLYVLHRCDQPSCVNPEHLFLGTQADNVADCAAKGRRNQLRPSRRKPKVPCSVDGCENLACTRGWCMKHYTRWYKQQKRQQAA